MRKLQKPPVAEAKTSKKEPLAEGLQITVPIGPKGRRLWSRMSDEEVVGYARKVMNEKGISGRHELDKADRGLYKVLSKRGLLGKVGFGEKRRVWKGISDEDILELAEKLIRENDITGRTDLKMVDSGLYYILERRELLERLGFEKKHKKYRSWAKMTDEEIVELARKVMEEMEISGRGELYKTDPGLYQVLWKRELLSRMDFEERKGQWKDMRDEEIVELARKVMEEMEISGRGELNKIDNRLYEILRIRGLLERVGFVDRQMKSRSWKHLSDEEVVEIAREVIKEREMTERNELKKADYGLYEVLRKRVLLGRVFAPIDQQKADQARDAVIDALEAFSVENDNGHLEDDAA